MADQTNRMGARGPVPYQTLVQSVNGIVWESNAETFEFNYVSPQAEEILGYPVDRWYEDNAFWNEHIHPDDRDYAVTYCHREASAGRDHTFEYRMMAADGRVVWLRDVVTVIHREGESNLLRGIMTDITDLKEAEAARRRERRDKEALINSTRDLIWSVSPQMELMAANEPFLDLMEELVGRRMQPGDDLGAVASADEKEGGFWIAQYERALRDESFVIQNTNPRLGEDRLWWETSLSPIREGEEIVGIACSSRNITRQKTAEEKMRRAKERYDIVSRATNDIIWDLDLVEEHITWYRSIQDQMGYDVRETSLDWWKDHLHPDDRERVEHKLERHIAEGCEKWEDEYRFAVSDGTYRYFYDRGFLVWNDCGEVDRMIGSMQDITERRTYEDKLEQLSLVASKTTDVIIITDAEERITWVNQAFEQLTGYCFEEAEGRKPGELLQGPDTDPDTVERLARAVESGESIQEVILNYDRNGEAYWLDMTINPIFNEEGELTNFIAIEKDVTDQKTHENRIRDALKEKETLLAEIHHRVKNNLAVVSGMMQLQAYDEENEEIRNKLLDSVMRIGSMATIHEQLYQSSSFSELDFSDNLRSLVDNVVKTIRSRAEVRIAYELEPIKLNVNQAIPSSLIVNEVVTNSMKHAFRDRESGEIRLSLAEEEESVILAVADDGVGLPDDLEVENSQTLGMNLIRTLAEQLDADYAYRSEGEGSLFELRFSRSEFKGIGSSHLQ
ncbi:MAG: PAS domain S-box protein [Balneolaceae bacterium]|nr:PAS domain S-box protein [Balneolaceae bacterium]